MIMMRMRTATEVGNRLEVIDFAHFIENFMVLQRASIMTV